ncbi:MAG: macro domain-containing protein [Phycisphaerales bacterium]|nr:macro domain-containing protein [Phycisphaerales bacterium]MCB9857336.1 macro domain-containing protein [Phycisphaerales bacterium]
MNIVLTSIEPPLTEAWTRYCGDLEFVRVHEGSIFDSGCDAVVSPANSFGFMDGGIDMLYSQRFGWGVQERLQALIREKHHGELLVGAAEIVETNVEQIPYVIAAPTMRVPMILNDSVNPYLAARAVLLLIQYGKFTAGPLEDTPIRDVVKSVAFPGLGTGVGRIGPNTCANQVRAAIDDVLHHKPRFPANWPEAQRRHQQMYASRIRDLQRE